MVLIYFEFVSFGSLLLLLDLNQAVYNLGYAHQVHYLVMCAFTSVIIGIFVIKFL